jgi:GntR family transcriptional regulator
MKIWLSKNSEVSVREQLVAQISLGIVSRDLRGGERLPSTRELARRFEIHPNTVSAAYRELAESNLVEFKKGSGVYVREKTPADAERPPTELDEMIARFVSEARGRGYAVEEIKSGLKNWLREKPRKHFLIVESDTDLRKILIEEIGAATGCTASGVSFEDFTSAGTDARIVAMANETARINEFLPPGKTCIYLRANSVADSLDGEPRPSETDLIAVASHWTRFLTWAKTYLLAARIEPDALVMRDAGEPDWKKGLSKASLIICDSATAKEFPDDERMRVFRLIADASLDELRQSIN